MGEPFEWSLYVNYHFRNVWSVECFFTSVRYLEKEFGEMDVVQIGAEFIEADLS